MGMFDWNGISAFFVALLEISLLSSGAILLILAVSPLLEKKHTVFWRYLLWVALAIRLAVPLDLSVPGKAVDIPLPAWLDGASSDGVLGKTDRKGYGKEGGALGGESGIAPPGEGNGNSFENVSQEEGLFGKENNSMERKNDSIGIKSNSIGIKGDSMERENDSIGIKGDSMEKKNNSMEKKNNSMEKVSMGRAAAGNFSQGDLREASAPIKSAILPWLFFLWLAGMAVSFAWQLWCYRSFCGRLEESKVFLMRKEGLPVYVSSAVASPMLVGIRNPQILLPDMECGKEAIAYILSHEFAHYKRKDLWVKLLLAVARTIHWFNPFVAEMERQASRDMELLCDSHVVENFTKEEKKQYGQVLLACAASRKNSALWCSSQFSKDTKALKDRLANLCSDGGRKKGSWAAAFGIGALLLGSLFVACGSTEGKSSENLPGLESPAKEESWEPMGEESEEGAQAEKENAYLQEKLSKLSGLSEKDAAEAIYGAVFPKLVYASEERAVLYDYWGLLIYDIEHQRISQLLDLEAAGLCFMQGDKATHVEVSGDGKQILLYNGLGTEERFVYYIDEKRLEHSDLTTFGENRYDGLSEREEVTYAMAGDGKMAYLSMDSLWTEEGEAFHGEDMQGLSLLLADYGRGEAQVFPLFQEYYESQGERAVSCLKIDDLRKVIGKELLYVDEEGWSYYLEEDGHKESPLQEVAPVLEPLLLTRYREGERQILEDLMLLYMWQECPVLFVDGRIVYKAAPKADIMGVKEPAMVSIAMDGSDRKIADMVLYHSFQGFCQDGGWLYYAGWTNEDALPKPLCRISPDFSSGPQFVEDIPGLLCGVMDGYVFYMAGEGKKPGIWKRSLATGEEQIHSKWGMAAEEFSFFNVREQEFLPGELREEGISGCHILFSYDHGGGLYASDEPFYMEE